MKTEEGDRSSNMNEEAGSMEEEEVLDSNSCSGDGGDDDDDEEADEEEAHSVDDNDEDSDSNSESGELSDSDEEEEESSDDGEHGGLSKYELFRLEKVARNQARLASLGLHEITDEMKKSKEQKKKTQQQLQLQKRNFDGPRRQLPGRSTRATSFFITEQSEKIKSAKAASSPSPTPPKAKKVKKNVDACWECQEDTGELHMCDYCRKLYHSTCDSNLNNSKEDISDDDFKCTICEKEGKNRRVPCGRCVGCKRDSDCETCVYCMRKMTAEDEATVKQKCIFRKCRNWGMRATVTIGGEDDGGGEESDDGHDAECNVCNTGGDMLCCDGCPRVFHSDCHKPKIHALPDEGHEWFCMYCSKKPKLPKEKKSKYSGPLLADLGDREVSCLVHFPKIECLVCEGVEITGAVKGLDWATCKICDDSFHLQCLEPPLETRPNNFRCGSCKESKLKNDVLKETKIKPLFEGVHDDLCYICQNGGKLLCCDFCEKVSALESNRSVLISFHLIIITFVTHLVHSFPNRRSTSSVTYHHYQVFQLPQPGSVVNALP